MFLALDTYKSLIPHIFSKYILKYDKIVDLEVFEKFPFYFFIADCDIIIQYLFNLIFDLCSLSRQHDFVYDFIQ